MTQEQIQYIQQVLKDSAQDIEDGEQAVQGLFNASWFLLRTVNKLDSEFVGLSEDGADLRYDFYQRVLKSAGMFLESQKEKPLSPNQRVVYEQLVDSVSQMKDQIAVGGTALADAKKELRKLEGDLNAINSDLAVIRNKVTYRTEQYQEARQKYEEKQQELQTLDAALEKYSASIPGLQAQVEEKQKKVAMTSIECDDLQHTLDENQKQLDAQEAENRELQVQIDAQPEELKQMHTAYRALSAELDEIENAIERCSEAKQEELRQQIDQLEPQAKKLSEDYEVLEAQKKKLEKLYTSNSAANVESEQALIDGLNEIMEDLRGHMGNLEEQLQDASIRAFTFSEHMEALKQQYDRLKGWMDADRPPLESMMSRLGLTNSENQALFRYFDLACCESIHKLIDEVSQGLTRMDEALQIGMTCVVKDNRDTRERAETNNYGARRRASERKA